jgi:hypothetical protein
MRGREVMVFSGFFLPWAGSFTAEVAEIAEMVQFVSSFVSACSAISAVKMVYNGGSIDRSQSGFHQ